MVNETTNIFINISLLHQVPTLALFSLIQLFKTCSIILVYVDLQMNLYLNYNSARENDWESGHSCLRRARCSWGHCQRRIATLMAILSLKIYTVNTVPFATRWCTLDPNDRVNNFSVLGFWPQHLAWRVIMVSYPTRMDRKWPQNWSLVSTSNGDAGTWIALYLK